MASYNRTTGAEHGTQMWHVLQDVYFTLHYCIGLVHSSKLVPVQLHHQEGSMGD